MKEDTPFSSDRWSGNWLWLRSYHCLNTLKLNSPNLNIVDYEAKMFDLLQQQLDLTNLVHLTESNISSIFNSHCYILNINAIFGKSQFKDSIVWMIQGDFFNWPPLEFAKCWPGSNRFRKNAKN